jgi:cysteinyl-tRNA synthetase
MITINGRKMGKSLGNFINLDEFFTGKHELLEKAYAPMTVRFYMLQAHYRSTLDFSNEALQSAEKAFAKLINSYRELDKLQPGDAAPGVAAETARACWAAMNDDLNTAIALSHLFEASRIVNAAAAGERTLAREDIEGLRKLFDELLFGVLGMRAETDSGDGSLAGLMDLVLSIRAEAKARKDFAVSDKIRDELNRLHFVIKDGKDGVSWSKG